MTEVLTQIVLVIGGSTELSILAKATAILLLALVALRIARRVPASVRSLVLASTFGVLLIIAWATGAVLFLVPVVETICRVRRMRRSASRWPHHAALVRTLCREAGVTRHVRVLVHEDLVAPFTYGVLRPAILMPADAQNWTDDEIRQAVIHELEHVRRADWPMHLLARVVCALYWFHPLVW